MKIRIDYVTNSSSSSFVIGKKDDNIVINDVFILIKEFYQNYLNKRDLLIQHINNHPELNLQYIEDDKYGYFKFINGKMCDKQNQIISKNIEDEFGLSLLDTFKLNYDWLQCETYSDYEHYWITKMQNTVEYIHAPFTIADFCNKEVKWLHFHNIDDQDIFHDINSSSDVLNWYFYNIEEIFKNNIVECIDCENNYWCDGQPDTCKIIKQKIINEKIPEEQACLYLLGRICIYSESGYMPDYVVDQLCDISEYSCNHMG